VTQKRRNVEEIFGKKALKITESENRLVNLNDQLRAVVLELDTKRGQLSDLNEDRESKETELNALSEDKLKEMTELENVKNKVMTATDHWYRKQSELNQTEESLHRAKLELNKFHMSLFISTVPYEQKKVEKRSRQPIHRYLE